MRIELSSPYSWIYRWAIPASLSVLAVLTLVVFGGILPGEAVQVSGVIVAVLVATVLVVIARIFDRAKRVWVEGDELIIGYYGKEVRVALSDVERAEVQPWFWPHRIRLTFRQPLPFGSHAVFFPPLSLQRPHPVQARLPDSFFHK